MYSNTPINTMESHIKTLEEFHYYKHLVYNKLNFKNWPQNININLTYKYFFTVIILNNYMRLKTEVKSRCYI